ncbi:MAG TPA: penicillin-binding protein [Bacteroidales bacterium]|nr:penicillin-binding protein [Bacteroidales bacterium]
MAEEPKNNQQNEEIRKEIRNRYTILVVFFFVPVLLILYNVAKIQFVEGKAWNKEAYKDRQENRDVPANRGNILSCDGQLMASTVPSYTLLMDFKTVEEDTLMKYLLPLSSRLAAKLKDKSPFQYQQHLLKGLHKQSTAWQVSRIKINYLDLKEIYKFPLFNKGQYKSGLYVRKYLQRKKPFGSLASRTIGDIYGDFSKGGKNGLELRYDTLLKGQPGKCVHRKIAGKYMDVNEVNPVDGIDLVTTIDVAMQDIAETALRRELNRIHGSSGTVVLMEVATGEVKAISNLGLTTSGEYAETKNFAVSDQSEPGSTFKTFSMIVGMEDGYIHPDDPVDAEGGVVVMYKQFMRDHNADKGGYGMISAKKSIWFSSNIGVSKLIDRYYHSQPTKFIDGLKRLGLFDKMNLEIPGSASPRIPFPGCKFYYWSPGSLPWMSIGYVATVPPIYTLAIYNAIANNGKLIRPFFVKGFSRDGKMVQEFKTETVREHICSDNTLTQIRLMLDSVVANHGTGKSMMTDVVTIAGKTGTAQLNYGSGGGLSHQVSFCGYFPADKPRYSGIVVIRDPKGEVPSGGHQAGGVYREMAERIYARALRLQPGDPTPNEKKKSPKTDSLKPLYPVVKAGNRSAIKVALASLNVPIGGFSTNGAEWVELKTSGSGVQLFPRSVGGKLMPNVLNMGAKDAVYLLGNMGLDIVLTGRGKVHSQSIQPGTYVRKGQRVGLTLDH